MSKHHKPKVNYSRKDYLGEGGVEMREVWIGVDGDDAGDRDGVNSRAVCGVF